MSISHRTTTPTVPLAPEELADEWDPSFGRFERGVPVEQRLALAVLAKAISDARGDIGSLEGMRRERRLALKRELMAEARAWLVNPENTGRLTNAAYICQALGYDHARLVARLEAGELPCLVLIGRHEGRRKFKRLWRGRTVAA